MSMNESSEIKSSSPSFGASNPLILDGVSYIPSDALLGGVRKVILKDNELFAVLDSSGELPRIYDRELGLYLRDTRYLDTWEMTLNGTTPTVLAAEAMPDVRSCVFTSTNQDMYSKEYGARIPRDRQASRGRQAGQAQAAR